LEIGIRSGIGANSGKIGGGRGQAGCTRTQVTVLQGQEGSVKQEECIYMLMLAIQEE
jgi:hypothetical protein